MAKNNRNINEVFNRKAVVSHEPDAAWPLSNELIGLEIECEDVNYPRGSPYGINSTFWTTHSDGSLRNGTEFVLASPTGGRQLTQAIDDFFNAGLTYNISPRTSIHVHVNASDNMTFDQFRNMFVLMYLFEPAVFRWADENRKWCGYCSPLTDLAPDRIINILAENNNDARFVQAVRGVANSDRYYGFNVSAFHRHGTVEFRYFPCTTDREAVIQWIKFCMYIKKTARAIESPEALVSGLNSERNVSQFIQNNFGDVANHVHRNLDYSDCVGRAAELMAMLNVDTNTVRTSSTYRTTRSRGMAKFLAANFPQAVTNDNPSEARPQDTASDLWQSVMDNAARRTSARQTGQTFTMTGNRGRAMLVAELANAEQLLTIQSQTARLQGLSATETAQLPAYRQALSARNTARTRLRSYDAEVAARSESSSF